MANYRSLTGGYFSDFDKPRPIDPVTKKPLAASIWGNNPGAINGAGWEESWPGYVKTIDLDGTNHMTIFEAPEHGVAVWYELMHKYQGSLAKLGQAFTIKNIIWRYGGGQSNYATTYLDYVVKRMKLPANYELNLTEDDKTLLEFAKAMFHVEAGRETPLTDAQILYGFELGRNKGATVKTLTVTAVATGVGATLLNYVGAHPWVIDSFLIAAVTVAAIVIISKWRKP